MQSNQPKTFFITATDTDAGKTTVTQSLILSLQKAGYSAIGCKPIACGLNERGDNEDVIVYQRINSLPLSKQQINPLCLALPASPDIAARSIRQTIKIEALLPSLIALQSLPVDFIFYEGIGGWQVPLNDHETTSDLALGLAIPILLVVGLRVGCINHALLTWDALNRAKVKVTGWIGNILDAKMPTPNEHINTLKHWISAPYLGTLPYNFVTSQLASYIELQQLINDGSEN